MPGRNGPPTISPLRLLVVLGIVAAIVFAASSLSPRHLDSWDQARLVPLVILVALVVFRLTVTRRAIGGAALQILVWLGIGAVLIAGYSYRDDIQDISGRMLGGLMPSRGVEIAPGTMKFSADDSGQFYVDAQVNGVGIHFLVDTGASGIALTQHDAQRLGLSSSDLRYSGRFSTANGTVRAAPVTLNSLSIGPFEAIDVPAWVNEGDLDNSLLGMSFLSSLGRIEIKRDSLILERAQ